MHKYRFKFIFIVFSLFFCLWGTGPAAGAGQPFKGVELNFLVISGHTVGLESRLPEFETQTGIKVNLIRVSMPDLYTKLGVEFAAGGSSYDVSEMMWEAAQGYARANKLLVLDEMIQKQKIDMTQYSAVCLDKHMIRYPQTAEGKIICLPHQADVQIMAYRRDLFENPSEKESFQKKHNYPLAPPKTFEQFLDIARFFTRDTNGDGQNDLFGTTVMGKNFPSLVGDITPYLRGFGGDWIGQDFRPVVNRPESIAGIQFYYDLFSKHKVTPPGAATYAWEDEIADFQNGKLAMMNIWPVQIVALEKKESSKVAGSIGYAVVPGHAPTLGGWSVAIPRTARNPEASFLFIQWLTQTRIALDRARETGFSTAIQALYDDPEMKNKYNYLGAVKTSLPYGIGWPQIGEFTSIWQIGAQELSRMFAGEVTVKEAADQMQKRLDQLMKDSGYY